MAYLLRRGVDGVERSLEHAELAEAGYHRVAEVLEASRQITWAYERNGEIFALEETAPVTDVQVVIIAGAPPSGLVNEAFQTQQDDDGTTRVYVQPCPYTARWAGIVLFHELDHVVDHRTGIWPAAPTDEDWWSAEARAYHHEALVIDALAGGRFLPILTEMASAQP